MPLVFVVDSFAERRHALQSALERAGYRVEVFATTHALEAAEQSKPRAMVIASVLPDGTGIELCRRIREFPVLSNTQLVLLLDSALSAKQALAESAADTVVSSPVIPEEVVAVLEWAPDRDLWHGSQQDGGDIFINSSAMRIAVRGKEVATTALEFRLIEYMARHQGKVFSRDALLDAVWGDLQFVTPRSVDACIRRVRRKIEPCSSSPTFLKSVRGIGYKLEANPVWQTDAGLCACPICSVMRTRKNSTASASSLALSRDNQLSLRRTTIPKDHHS